MKNTIANIFIGAAGMVGSLTLPELAGTLAGFGTFAWMMVQCYLAIRRSQRTGCGRANCPRRVEER